MPFEKEIEQLRQLQDKARQMGGPEKIRKQHDQGKSVGRPRGKLNRTIRTNASDQGAFELESATAIRPATRALLRSKATLACRLRPPVNSLTLRNNQGVVAVP